MDLVGARAVPALRLFDPARHEPLRPDPWNAGRARDFIERFVADAEARFSETSYWPAHPRDYGNHPPDPLHCLYFGACGVIWTLHYLQALGAAKLRRSYEPFIAPLGPAIQAWMGEDFARERHSYLMGETSPVMLSYWLRPDDSTGRRLEAAIDANIDNPTRELMWGAPGTMLAAAFLHERTGETRWADAFRRNARHLEAQLLWSDTHRCHYWTQDMYGHQSTYLDGVHGFVATASVLIRGRGLLDPDEWNRWQERLATTIRRTATIEGKLANWRAFLDPPPHLTGPMLVQLCHGAPGFVTCLGDFPGDGLDDLLLAGAELTWQAGPLAKGANLCHGTAGNGYAFLKLFRRTRDSLWLDRARAFAMHAIAQSQAETDRHGRMWYSLWTGDAGVAVYLADCLREAGDFPTLDVFFAPAPTR